MAGESGGMPGDLSCDEELVRQFQSGRKEAFDTLVLRYQKDVYRIAWRFTGDHAEADDLAQETFCRAFSALGQFRGESSLRTWLLRIVSNLSLNVVQSARITRRDGTTLEDLSERGVAGTVSSPQGTAALVARERDDKLHEAIRRLPPRQRSTLILRVFEELPYREIATMMGCTTGTAKANFFHAVAALRRAMKEPI